ncbi:hypothetical protein AAEO57_15400 [Flavobacterium sp. DGU38]|uniref:Uncharacterized protein n=1 Tax=Flavobacterium calami TaxID=3139144 RepID=A0ABU9ISN8_9FLAO
MNFTEEELEKQEKEIRFNLFLVFVPIAVMLFIIKAIPSIIFVHNMKNPKLLSLTEQL